MKLLLPSVMLASAAIALSLSGCATDNTNKEADSNANALTSREKPLNFQAPKGKVGSPDREKWIKVPRPGGAEYVQAKDGMADLVNMYGFSHPMDATVKSIDALEASLKGDSSLGFATLKRGDVLGVPVLRFEKLVTDTGGGTARLASSLGLQPRQSGMAYQTRTRGAFVMKSGREPMLVTLACARTSIHGEIGTYYEELFEEYLAAFIADNLL